MANARGILSVGAMRLAQIAAKPLMASTRADNSFAEAQGRMHRPELY